ncbi:MAG: DNA polymerase-3 subunit alpha, partial [Paracoccaceae bacterium]
MNKPSRFIHLRTHTEYSLLEGAIRLKKLSGFCADADMPAIAVTDTNNMFAALEFSETLSAAGIQPIVGCQLDVEYAQAAHPGEMAAPPRPLVFLAQTEAGYENLMKLNSTLFLEAGNGLP